MPPTNTNDPLRTTDHVPSAAPAGPDVTADLAPGSSPINGGTAAYVPGQAAERMGTEPECASRAVSVPGYEIEGVLGRGGMGVVYKARHLALKRSVALKLVLAGGHAGPRELARFRIEAEAVARLQHPNIVQVFEVGEAGGYPFCALEFVAGGSLAEKLAGRPQPPGEAARLVRLLAEAVHLAHSRNVVHRDLKPANVLLTEGGVPKIADFGLARQLDADSGQTQAGAVMGTPSYMAPEQAGGQASAAGPAADVYALGAILYECLTGRPPFRGATVLETLEQVRSREPVPPRLLQPRVPRDLETVCLRCLHKEPERRYPSAQELADDLGRFLRGEPVLARPVGALGRLARWARRRPAVALLLAAVALVTLAGGGAFYWKYREAEEEARLKGEALGKEQEARTLADDKTRKALEAENAQKEEAGRTAWQARRAEAARYALQLGSARRELEAGGVSRARDLLDQCRWDLRHFEHHYLRGLCERGPAGGPAPVVLRGHTEAVTGVALSPNGERLASSAGEEAAEVRVWDVRPGRLIRVLPEHGEEEVSGLAFSGDSRRLATAAPGRGVAVWEVDRGRPVRTFRATDIHGVALSADGRLLATATPNMDSDEVSEGFAVTVWDIATGKAVHKLKGRLTGAEALVTVLAFSPDDRRLAVSGNHEVLVWDFDGGKGWRTLRGHAAEISGLAFAPDSRILASAGKDGMVLVWDVPSGQRRFVLRGEPGGLAFSPDGNRLAAGAGETRVWDPHTGQELLALGQQGGVRRMHDEDTLLATTALAFGPGGRLVGAASNGAEVKTWTWDGGRGQDPLTLRGHAGSVTAVAFSPDGKRLASATGVTEGNRMVDEMLATPPGEAVKVWDLRSGQEALPLEGHAWEVTGVAFSPDGRRLATASGGYDLEKKQPYGEVKVWDTGSGQAILSLRQPGTQAGAPALGVAFSPDGRYLAGAGMNEVKVWDALTGREEHTFRGTTSVAFSPDGKLLASPGGDGTVKVWELATGRLHGALRAAGGLVAFTPDGTRLAATAAPANQKGPQAAHGVTVFDLAMGQEVFTVRGHTDLITGVCFSPDGKLLASASRDGTVKGWDATTGRPVLSLRGHPQGVWGVAISPDGKRLAAGGGKVVQIWDLNRGR